MPKTLDIFYTSFELHHQLWYLGVFTCRVNVSLNQAIQHPIQQGPKKDNGATG